MDVWLCGLAAFVSVSSICFQFLLLCWFSVFMHELRLLCASETMAPKESALHLNGIWSSSPSLVSFECGKRPTLYFFVCFDQGKPYGFLDEISCQSARNIGISSTHKWLTVAKDNDRLMILAIIGIVCRMFTQNGSYAILALLIWIQCACCRARERTKQYEQDKNNYKYQGCILSECWSFTLSIAYVNNTNNYQMHKNKRLFSRPLEPTQIEQKLLSHANNRSLAPEKFVYFSAFIIAVNSTRTPKAISTIRSITMLYAKAANKQSMTTKSQPIGWMR